MGALAEGITTMRSAAQGFDTLCDPTSTLSSGCSLCEKVVSDRSLCGRASRELPALGEMLVRARRSYADSLVLIEKGAKSGLEGLPTVKKKVEEKHGQSVVAHLERFTRFLGEVDDQLNSLERTCVYAGQRAVQLGQTCQRHRGFKSAAGGLLLFSGCFVFMVAVAAVVGRRNLNKTISAAAKSSNKMAALMGGLPPVNAGLTGGVVAVLGARATSNATTHSRLAFSFQKLEKRMGEQTAALQALRTRFQRLSRSVESVAVHFRIQAVVGGVDPAVWRELSEWVDVYEGFLRSLLKKTAGIPAA